MKCLATFVIALPILRWQACGQLCSEAITDLTTFQTVGDVFSEKAREKNGALIILPSVDL